jgi:Prp8 binding protein
MSLINRNDSTLIVNENKRPSSLLAPIMLFTGHQNEVLSVKFSPNGKYLASSSFDRSVLLWNSYTGENYLMCKGHSAPVIELCWSFDNKIVFSCSVDKTICAFDTQTGQLIKRFKGHSSIINTLCPLSSNDFYGGSMIASGSDDGSIRFWDLREKYAVKSMNCHFPVTSVAFSNDNILYGGISTDITGYSLTADQEEFVLQGHTDMISCLRTSPSGDSCLSVSFDNTIRTWDVKPFSAVKGRLLGVIDFQYGSDKALKKACWSNDGSQISCGNGDRTVMIWKRTTGEVLYKLPGHKGSIHEVCWHPFEQIIASGSTDRLIYVGEIGK